MTRLRFSSFALVLLLALTSACGQTAKIVPFGKRLAGAGTSSSTSTNWSGPTSIDLSASGPSNYIANTNSAAAPFCINGPGNSGTDYSAGFSGSGCVQQAQIAYSGRWFVGFPQKQTQVAAAAAYDYFNIMTAMASASTHLFSGTGSLLGLLDTALGAGTEVARYVSYATLSSGKVVAVYWVYDSTSGGSEVYANVYNPTTSTWGLMTPLSTGSGSYREGETRDIAWDAYGEDGADVSGYAGNFCRPQVAASGTHAMAVWCERVQLPGAGGDYHTYVRYARYNGSSWLQEDARPSSALHAKAGSAGNGMNEDSLGTADIRLNFHPGMARRIPVPAFVPNALFVVNPTIDSLRVLYPIPRANAAPGASVADFDYGDATDGAEVTPSGYQLVQPGDITEPRFVATDGTRLFAVESDMVFPGGNHSVKLWNSIPKVGQAANDPSVTIDATDAPSLLIPTSVHSDGTRMIVTSTDTAGTGIVHVWNSIPATPTAPSFEITGLDYPMQAIIVGTKLIVTDITTATTYIWNSIPTAATNVGSADVEITGIAFNIAVHSDGTRLFIGGTSTLNGVATQRIHIWNKIPTADTHAITGAQAADVLVSTGGVAPVSISSDGLRMFMTNGGDTNLYIWNSIPLEDKAADVTVDIGAMNGFVAWGKFLPPSAPTYTSSTDWPSMDSRYSEYSVNPGTNDTLTVRHRGRTATISGFVGDPLTNNRCSAISEVVNRINANSTIQAMNIRAQLPTEWEGPACDDSLNGVGQFFYITHNPDFNPDDGYLGCNRDSGANVELPAQCQANGIHASAATAAATDAIYSEDIRIVLGDDEDSDPADTDADITRFFAQMPAASANFIEAINPTVAGSAAQHILGRMNDDSNSVSNGYPVVPVNASASNPVAATESRFADITGTSFLSVAGSGSGVFQLVQASKSLVMPFYKMMCSQNSDSPGCTTWAGIEPVNSDLIPSELSLPRVLFGYRFTGTDWTRLHTSTMALPAAKFIGPQQPYAVDYSTGTVQSFPFGARWPRMISSGSGKGLVLFYARAGQRPARSISSADYGRGSASYDEPQETTAANALWMALYDDATGFTTAAPISPNTTADRSDPSSLNTDLDVCESADTFGGEAAGSDSLGDATDACHVGVDPYIENTTLDFHDQHKYTYDVSPIPAAMNSSGQAVIGFHRLDTGSGTGQRVGFYVAHYGPLTGLGGFTQIDSGVGLTFGGALAIDESGNIAAVWEERYEVNRDSRSCTGGPSGTAAENHVFYRYYTASTGTWGSITQVDDDDITCYGNTVFTHAPKAPMMPNVAINSSGRVLVTWSGPACNVVTSISCRRRQLVNEYEP